jgi:hypothetical protein
LDPFVYHSLPLRVVFGEGTPATLAEEADLLAVRGALVLTTPSHERLGLEMAERLGDRFAGLFVGAVMRTPVGVTEEAMKRARGAAGGSRAVGPLSGVRRFRLRHRYRVADRWRPFHHAHLSRFRLNSANEGD